MKKYYSGKITPERALLILKSAGAEPLEPYPNNQSKKWACRCLKCNKEIYPRMLNLARGSKACKYCQHPLPIDPKEAEALLRSLNVEPLEPYPGYPKQPWKVRCNICGHESSPSYSNISRGQGACFRCGGNYEFSPACVYLFHEKQLGVLKIGITNARGHRLTKYPGWEVVELVSTDTGKEAKRIEAEVLRHWRIDLGLKPKLTRRKMPRGGYTETADESGLEGALKILSKYQ